MILAYIGLGWVLMSLPAALGIAPRDPHPGPAITVTGPTKELALRPADPTPTEEGAYRAGLAEGFHRAWTAVMNSTSRYAAEPVLREALRHGLTGEDVTRQ